MPSRTHSRSFATFGACAGCVLTVLVLSVPAAGSGIGTGSYVAPFGNGHGFTHLSRSRISRNATLTVLLPPSANVSTGRLGVEFSLVVRPGHYADAGVEIGFAFPISVKRTRTYAIGADWFDSWSSNVSKGGAGRNNLACAFDFEYIYDQASPGVLLNWAHLSYFGCVASSKAGARYYSNGSANTSVRLSVPLNSTQRYELVTGVEVALNGQSRFGPNGAAYFDLAPPYGAWLENLTIT